MVKRYYLDERPEGRSKEEQAKINKQNEAEQWQHLIETLEKVKKGTDEYFAQKQRMRLAIDNGEIAIVSEELSILEFNDDYTVAKYDNKQVKFKKSGLESEMLRILARAATSKNKVVQEEYLISSLERATGRDDIIYKTVRNTRDRINKKLHDGLGLLSEVVKIANNSYQLEEGYLHPSKGIASKGKQEFKPNFFLDFRG